MSEPQIGRFLLFSNLVPWAVAKAIQASDERMGEHAIGFLNGEENKNVQQEGGDGIGLLAAGAQADGGLAR